MEKFGIAVLIVCLTQAVAQFDDFDIDHDLHSTVMTPETTTMKNKSWGYIYPGTKWCGKGNKAANDEDFGRFKRTDACCRDHDRCPDKIRAGDMKYGLQNNGSVTMLSCQCDETFYDCLKGVRTRASKIVGTLYFDIVKNKCFKPSEENSENFIITNNPKFSSSRFVQFVGRLFN